MTSPNIFFPDENTSLLVLVGGRSLPVLPPFSLWVDGTWPGLQVPLMSPADVPPKKGVYVFVKAEPFGRLEGASDILYIGCTGRERPRAVTTGRPSRAGESDLCSRMGEYGHVAGGRRKGSSSRSGAEIPIARYYAKHGGDVKLGWLPEETQKEAEDRERDLLTWYVEDHGELPPFNRQIPKPVPTPVA